MRLIVAGGREFTDWTRLCGVLEKFRFDRLVCGMARGADQMAFNWASSWHIPIDKYPADWLTHGKAAGFLRNEQMAKNADALIAFWDGESRGTKHMIDLALKLGLEVHVYRYRKGGDGVIVRRPTDDEERF